MRPPLVAVVLALLSVLSVAAWGAVVRPRPALAAALRHRLQTRGSFVRLGRSGALRAELDEQPEEPEREREQSEPELAEPLLGEPEEVEMDGGDEEQEERFDRMVRPSFVRLGRLWMPRGSRASSIRLGRRSPQNNESLPTSYKRYRIRLKRDI